MTTFKKAAAQESNVIDLASARSVRTMTERTTHSDDTLRQSVLRLANEMAESARLLANALSDVPSVRGEQGVPDSTLDSMGVGDGPGVGALVEFPGRRFSEPKPKRHETTPPAAPVKLNPLEIRALAQEILYSIPVESALVRFSLTTSAGIQQEASAICSRLAIQVERLGPDCGLLMRPDCRAQGSGWHVYGLAIVPALDQAREASRLALRGFAYDGRCQKVSAVRPRLEDVERVIAYALKPRPAYGFGPLDGVSASGSLQFSWRVFGGQGLVELPADDCCKYCGNPLPNNRTKRRQFCPDELGRGCRQNWHRQQKTPKPTSERQGAVPPSASGEPTSTMTTHPWVNSGAGQEAASQPSREPDRTSEKEPVPASTFHAVGAGAPGAFANCEDTHVRLVKAPIFPSTQEPFWKGRE